MQISTFILLGYIRPLYAKVLQEGVLKVDTLSFINAPTSKPVGSYFFFIGTNGFSRWSTNSFRL